jgi:cytochrome c
LTRDGEIFQAVIFPAIILFTLAILPVVAWTGVAAPAEKDSSHESPGEKLIKANDCTSCHAIDVKVVGPAYREVAKKYRGQPNAVQMLSEKIKQGGYGDWGEVPMKPHAGLTTAQLRQMVMWILSQGDPPAKKSAAATRDSAQPRVASKMYSYPLADGASIRLDFPVFVARLDPKAGDQKVTKDVFSGYEMYNSYCYRCHGQDVTGSEIAPDLRHSLSTGMTEKQFFSIVMAGRPEKGMPSWAGFFNAKEAKQVFEYVKGRSLDLVPVGRPPSETD